VRRESAAALLLDLLGAGLALLVSTRTWQSVVIERPGLVPVHLGVHGRAVDGSVTALAVAALASVVAVLATRGVLRRAVGALVLLVGAATVWRSLHALSAISTARARSLAAQHHAVASATAHARVHVTPAWPWTSALAGLLIVLAGSLVALRGHRWQAMSARYEAPAAEDERTRARADLSMWKALDRGEDPTSGPGVPRS
jgi:uncharacterized membrane protein (TIGR02234 family)